MMGFGEIQLVDTLRCWEGGILIEYMETLGPLSLIPCPKHLFHLAIMELYLL